jgi:hypothetical protein
MESSERTMVRERHAVDRRPGRPLASDTSTLLRQEVQLAKVELSRKARKPASTSG